MPLKTKDRGCPSIYCTYCLPFLFSFSLFFFALPFLVVVTKILFCYCRVKNSLYLCTNKLIVLRFPACFSGWG